MQLEWLDHWTADCAARHVGLWLIEPSWFQESVEQIRAGMWRPLTHTYQEGRFCNVPAAENTQTSAVNVGRPPPAEEDKPYFLDATGMAVIPIDGQMMKGSSKYGGANTVQIRRQVRAATKDPDVTGIMLLIDSPGGTVAGTEDLASDVSAANTVKPVFAHVEDLGASAAYWVASQTRRITATPTSEVGSIGTMAVVEDYSAVTEKKGIKIHVISTGPYKGAGVPGTPITDEHLAYVRERIEDLNSHFLDAVSRGRNQSPAKVQEWADGRVWIADKAKAMGLIDGVELFDDAISAARALVAGKATPQKAAPRKSPRAYLEEMNKICITDIQDTKV